MRGWFRAITGGLRGWALCRLGQTREGIEALRHGIELMRKLGARILLPYHLHLLADVSVLLGQVEQGLAAVGEALALIEETGARVFESELRRLQAELLRMAGREEEALLSSLRPTPDSPPNPPRESPPGAAR
ncbi:hypothetical protein ACN28E_09575 [Archangium lansingense]|uniref:hypothetical protein n=1 Tax=Archangium lansingense TaxID=2995310 RepID=UPI003B80AF77